MKSIYLFLTLILLVSCGARKVDKMQTHFQQHTEQNNLVASHTAELDWSRDMLYELLYTADFRADKIEITNDKTTLYGAQLQTEGKESKAVKETATASQNSAMEASQTNTGTTQTTNTKQIDKKQYNWWYGVPVLSLLIGSISFLIYIYRKKIK